MKLLERTHGKHAPERAPETHEHKVSERVVVPDDLRGLADLPSIGEGRQATIEPRRAESMVRWLRWVPVVLLALAGAVAAMLLTDGGDQADVTTTVEAPWSWETDGPGSHSLTATWLMGTEVPWASEFEGPGGNSLNAMPLGQVAPAAVAVTPAFDWAIHGPGGHLMGQTPMLQSTMSRLDGTPPFDWAVYGPGGHLMGQTPMPQIAPAPPFDWAVYGPGGHLPGQTPMPQIEAP